MMILAFVGSVPAVPGVAGHTVVLYIHEVWKFASECCHGDVQ